MDIDQMSEMAMGLAMYDTYKSSMEKNRNISSGDFRFIGGCFSDKYFFVCQIYFLEIQYSQKGKRYNL